MAKTKPKTARELVEKIHTKLTACLEEDGVKEWNDVKQTWVNFADKHLRIQHWYVRKEEPKDGVLLKEYKYFKVFLVKRKQAFGNHPGISSTKENQLFFVPKKM